jgi:pentose-5-phosphate-3-epimerase
LHFPIEIDGGVDAQNVTEVVDAGVEWVVSGTSIFHSVTPRAAYEEMRSLAQNASAVKV